MTRNERHPEFSGLKQSKGKTPRLATILYIPQLRRESDLGILNDEIRFTKGNSNHNTRYCYTSTIVP